MTIHVLNEENMRSYCEQEEIGDKAITLAATQDPETDDAFDCSLCYEKLHGVPFN